jgi:hypothetical protein
MPECAVAVGTGAAGSGQVEFGSGQVVPANPTGIVGGIYPQSFPLDTLPPIDGRPSLNTLLPIAVAGSVPPGVPVPMPTIVTSAGGCGMIEQPTWRCTDEITSSTDTSSADNGWRDFTVCEPVYSAVASTEAVPTTVVVSPSPTTTVEPSQSPTSTIPVDPVVTTNP